MRSPHVRLAFALIFLVVATQLTEPLSVMGQRRGGGGGGSKSSGRTASQSSSVSRSSPARSGSTDRSGSANRSTTANRSTPSDRSTPANRPGSSGRPGSSTRPPSVGRPGTPGRGTNRNVRRRPANPSRSRHRSRHMHSSRYRRAGWSHHRYGHHRRWYRGWWVGAVLITTAAFVAIANSSNTVVVSSTTYYHYNPWYRRALYDGEEVYVLSSAPVGYKTDQVPSGAEIVDVEGATYYYAEGAFYQKANGGYRVVEAPVGAEVSSIPKESISREESEMTLYQFDKTSFTKHIKDGGGEVYRVEPQPPAEELDSMPADAPTFVADGETYYYVNYNLYVPYEEDGQTGFVNGEPEIGAQVDSLPKGVTTIEENGKTYYQFDMVFFEEVQDANGNPFYEVVGSPDGSEAVELES